MRAGGGHLREVGLDWPECLVFGSAEEICELPLVDAVVVHLLMVKTRGADELVWPELRKERWSQACISGQLSILSKPLGESAGADAEAKAFLEMCGNMLACLTAIVAHESIHDDSKRECFALGNLGSEDAVTVMATPELDSLQFLVAFAFPRNAQAVAVEAALALVTDQALMSTRCNVWFQRMRHRGKRVEDTSSLTRWNSLRKGSAAARRIL